MKTRPIALIALVVLVAALAGVMLARMMKTPLPVLANGTWLGEPRIIAPFKLKDLAGNPFTNQSLVGTRPKLVFFGYTACPDICPTTLSLMSEVYKTRVADGLPDFQVLFITVDPERDTAENLRQYLNAFSTEFLGARGDNTALAPLMTSLGAVAMKVPRSDGSYSMDHTASAFWIDKQGRYQAVFSAPLTPEALRADLRRIVAAGAG